MRLKLMKKMHYQADVLERFIPISLEMLISDLLNSSSLLPEQHGEFSQFCNNYIALFHAQSHQRLTYLKNIYQTFNPDRDTLITNKVEPDQQLTQFKADLYQVLEDANYEKISENDLSAALNKISPHGVKVSVDFDEFSEVSLFYRGSAIHTEFHRNFKRLKFKKQATDIQVYRRLFVLLQPKNREQWIKHLTLTRKISLKRAEKQVDASLKTLGISGENDVVYMKLFKDIPRADLEMLFPNTRVQIRLFDKIKLGLTGGGGAAGGIMATITKLSAAIDPISAILAVGGLLGVIWRQIAKIFSQRAKYSAILTKNLYFYSLNNNMATLTYLIDSAESEECKEAILSYFFLLTGGESNRVNLDRQIEDYIQQKYSIPMDFEIDDGLDKLEQSELLSCANDVISAISLPMANTRLIEQWNSLIQNNTAPTSEE